MKKQKYKIALSTIGNGRKEPQVFISKEQIEELNKCLKENEQVNGFEVYLEKRE